MTLADFLLARIAEDEEVARDVFRLDTWHLEHGGWRDPRTDLVGGGKILAEFDDDHGQMAAHHVVRWNPERVLAECEAKRRIVEEHGTLVMSGSWQYAQPRCQTCADWDDADYDGPPTIELPCTTLRVLALPYADHPEFQEDWRA